MSINTVFSSNSRLASLQQKFKAKEGIEEKVHREATGVQG